MEGLHISLKAEEVFHLFGYSVTNSMLATVAVSLFFFIVVIIFQNKKSTAHAFIRGTVAGLYNFSESIVGEKKAQIFFPVFATFFLYIIFSNWFGLLPGLGGVFWKTEGTDGHGEAVHLLRAPTADLNTTLALAIFSVLTAQFYGFKYLGAKVQLSKFFDFSNPINFFVGILELISEVSKILSFSFRLFGNVFAGEVLLLVIGFLIPLVATTPFLILELFVGFIQALVFAMLSLVFISLAVEHH
jgi:F-type H+-transporting ATPase subunit a